MFRLLRNVLAVIVVAGWVVGCSDMGAPIRLVPRLELSADALTFGTLAVGDSASRTVIVGNSGSAPLAGDATLACADFRIRSGGGPFTVPPGGTHEVEVVYLASGVGASACELDLGGGLPRIALTGGGALQSPGAQGQVSTGTLEFGQVRVGQSGLAVFRIYSTGTAPLRVDVSAGCSGFDVLGGGGSAQIAPGDSLVVTVSCAPTAGGRQTCVLSTGPGLPDVVLGADATTVSWLTDIRPIFQAQFCNSCHTYNSPTDIVNVTSVLGYAPAKLVVPRDPAASVLYNKVANTGRYGGAMPQGTAGLSVAQRDKLRAWILEGAFNN